MSEMSERSQKTEKSDASVVSAIHERGESRGQSIREPEEIVSLFPHPAITQFLQPLSTILSILMSNTRKPQLHQNVFSNQTNPTKTQKPHGAVGQDNDTPGRIYEASPQPPYATDAAYRQPLVKTPQTRTQNHTRDHAPLPARPKHHGSNKRQLVEVAGCVPRQVAEQIERMRDQGGSGTRLSRSAVVAALLTKSVQEHLDLQYGALLEPVIKQAIAREIRTMTTRLAWLLVRVAFDAGQTRSLVTNILGRQPGVTPEVLKTILEGSGKTAKANITRRTPQLIELIEAVEAWILAGNEEEQDRSH